MKSISLLQVEQFQGNDENPKNPSVEISVVPKCSFTGRPADFFVALSDDSVTGPFRIVGSVRKDMVETAINNLLGKGADGIQWPVVLNIDKQLIYHTHSAHCRGLSAILGWKETMTKIS